MSKVISKNVINHNKIVQNQKNKKKLHILQNYILYYIVKHVLSNMYCQTCTVKHVLSNMYCQRCIVKHVEDDKYVKNSGWDIRNNRQNVY